MSETPDSGSVFSTYMPKKKKTARKGMWKYLLMGLLIVGMLSPFLFYGMVSWGFFGPLPTADELQHIQRPVASIVYDKDKKVLGRYYLENRTEVAFEKISPHVWQALIATEDARFEQHAGVDWKALGRVAVKSVLLRQSNSGGGSTISQQLAKNLFPRQSYAIFSLPINKVREMIIAKRLEKLYGKEEILTLYLNTVPFGERVFGIGAATERFFSTTPSEIAPEKAAVLVGMLKGTTSYNPRRNPERSVRRRNLVLGLMANQGFLTPDMADSLQQLDLGLAYRNIEKGIGKAPYFRQALAEELKVWLANHPKPDGSAWNLYTDGLRIHTTIDSRIQDMADKAVKSHLASLQKQFDQHWKGQRLWNDSDPTILRAIRQSDRYRSLAAQGKQEAEILEIFRQPVEMERWNWTQTDTVQLSPLDSIKHYLSFLQAGFLVMEAETGHILAWVGGGNFEQFKYDHVTSQRQVGSTFKPFVYAAALDKGRDPCEYIANQQQVYPEYNDWSPGNAGGKYGGYYSMQGGLTNSVNTISAEIMMDMGPGTAVKYAREFGFSSTLPEEPSLVLGTADLTLHEMVGAYSAFANQGWRVAPVSITHINDAQGETLISFPQQSERNRAMSPEITAMMQVMLRSVVDSGTARRLRFKYGIQGQIGGKTGTTQNQSDGWFMGFTPQLVLGAWVGGETRKVRFRSLSLGQGAATALPIAGLFLKDLYAHKSYRSWKNDEFSTPGLSITQSMDCPLYSWDGSNPNDKKGLRKFLDQLRDRQKERKSDKQQKREDRRKRNRDAWEELFKRKKRAGGS